MFKFEKPGFELKSEDQKNQLESKPEKQNKETGAESNKIKRLLKMAAMLTMLLGNEVLGAEPKNYEKLQKEIAKIEAVVKNHPDMDGTSKINGVPYEKVYLKRFKTDNAQYEIDVKEKTGFFIQKKYINKDSGVENTHSFFDKRDAKTGKLDGKVDCVITMYGKSTPQEDSAAMMDITSQDDEMWRAEAEVQSYKHAHKHAQRSSFENRGIFKIDDNKTIFVANMENGNNGIIDQTNHKKEYEEINGMLQSSYSTSIEDINKIIEGSK
jgi:hypothetical protein